ncbi:5-methyltetrahydropteroyltriglutamate--homocysteine S-methyltransferase [Galbibacter sp.]|uniref:5-methyltetrahydropteroyltriglutamate-- homocysteine S-methyltransferase n=1 Tax=Galbibacter sp. TaxID=2918471 RepID=UPI002BCBB96B|nr:5-methyltetrahydropteroyltriglutamate--homocysteine S-methyltransferase [Galbibacter sp.]HLV62172.1 5-methyltetrahydropteroyltriglutamate--homocysteine S-methyltransferase [Galbibacter sp.]
MITHNLGYPRIGAKRELKFALEDYWSGKISQDTLLLKAKELRKEHWLIQQQKGIELIPTNDFSLYDQVLDLSFILGAIPPRYKESFNLKDRNLDLYFAMARGQQREGADVIAMEMTKWFDTNYHYIVPEFYMDQEFELSPDKILNELQEAIAIGITPKPVLIGPLSYLLLGKEKEPGFNRLSLLEKLLPVYIKLLQKIKNSGASWIQIDEPFLVMDVAKDLADQYKEVFKRIANEVPGLKVILATYFGDLDQCAPWVAKLPVYALHIDLVRGKEGLDKVLESLDPNTSLSLGIVDGRNIWKNDYKNSLELIEKATGNLGASRVLLAPSCSLLHVPFDLDQEHHTDSLPNEVKNWMAFAKQKLKEVVQLCELAHEPSKHVSVLEENTKVIHDKLHSELIHKKIVKQAMDDLVDSKAHRLSEFKIRQSLQKAHLRLPLFPTTTIGSFPQTTQVRALRSRLRNKRISQSDYDLKIAQAIKEAVLWQEEIGLDVLVHGEFERNDMVEYFGEQLEGFVFTKFGWVQSYGSRAVKPPIIFGDVHRPHPMTVKWTSYAQGLTGLPVKGMLTGPVTILQWSFVRDDQPCEVTANQIALAIGEEVRDLEKAGIKIIQIDEPAIREGLPLKRKDWEVYLDWAINAFRISAYRVKDTTQIHTHMCYSEFNDIIKHIAAMDADVITIETSRSHMELLEAFVDFKYPNEIGPGVYDIHSPRVPSENEMIVLLEKAANLIPIENLWVNPDCGLKTRGWQETKDALIKMVNAAKALRKRHKTDLVH